MTIKTTRRTNRERRADSTAGVERAACRLFVSRGYRSTSMELIAREASLTKGAVYFYYKDKQSLLLALLARSEAQLFTKVFEEMDAADGPGARIGVFLNQIGRAGAEIEQNLLLLPVLMSAEFKGRGGEAEGFIRAIYARVYARLEDVIKAGQGEGVFTTQTDARALAAMIVALTDGLLLEIYRDQSGVDGKAILQTARETVLAMLGAG